MISLSLVKFLSALVISTPLSFVFQLIKQPSYRKFYSMLMGILLQLWVYGFQLWIPFVIHVLIYSIIKLKGRKCGLIITVVGMALLSGYHIYRTVYFYGLWITDVSTVLMTIVVKYSMFAYAYQDGAVQENNQDQLKPFQKRHRIMQLPSFYDFLGYCVFLPTCVIGTGMEYIDYINFMELKHPFNNIPFNLIKQQIWHDSKRALLCLGIYIFGMMMFPVPTVYDDSVDQQHPLYIVFYYFFCVCLIKYKYYFGWLISQCALHASGISYSDQGKFNRIETCDPYVVQTTLLIRTKIANWNMSAQYWLKYCIYERVRIKDRGMRQLITFMVSAFWHGFYGGYYYSFMLWFMQLHLQNLILQFSKNKSHWINQLYIKTGKYGNYLLNCLCISLFTVNGLYFQILSARKSFFVLSKLYFIPPIILIVLIVFFMIQNKKTAKTVRINTLQIGNQDKTKKL